MAAAPAPDETIEQVVAEREGSLDRLLVLSDGVFAIAITLLVLDIKVPHVSESANLAQTLWGLLKPWPAYLGYVLGFVTIAIMWANHCTLFRYIRRGDHLLMKLNTLLLLNICFVPFVTSLLAEYLTGSPDHQKAGAFAYSLTNTVMALCFNFLWWHARRKGGHLLDPSVPQHLVDQVTRRYRFGPLTYLVVTLISLWSVPVCLGIIAALAIIYALPYNRAAAQKEARAFERLFQRRL